MSLSKSRKRSYRYRVKCKECEEEFDSHYIEAHPRVVHSGRKCLPVVESSHFFFLMAVLNYSVFLASELFCCLLTTPFEEKPFAFLFYISFEESISYRVYSRVDNL